MAKPGKVLVVYGPRRVGKTTLVKHMLSTYFEKEKNLRTKYYTLDDASVSKVVDEHTMASLSLLVRGYDVVVFDEAQRSPHIGIALKLLADSFENTIFIATGSSSFGLLQNIGEPLAGRMYMLMHYPFSFNELSSFTDTISEKSIVSSRLIYGSYPETILQSTDSDREMYLDSLIQSYLYKDVLALEGIRKPKLVEDVLTLLAYQIGQPVNIVEIAKRLEISKATVKKYIDILCEAFIIVRLTPYSNNLRNEIHRTERYFFYDLGIRNALIGAFAKIETRNDVGYLWENYCVLERMKYNQREDMRARYYFWRTRNQAEVDLVEKHNDHIRAFECKYTEKSPSAKSKKAWGDLYPSTEIEVINKDNFVDYVSK
ncbi:MAG: ATP-binding protein [Candidatus Yonathbacteria bacterium]|nr:ATP-binding protein [Candidatus Yonathbacteria bacterium]